MNNFVPKGSYMETSEHVMTVLHCKATRADQTMVPASYLISELNGEFDGLVNWNGQLAPEKDPIPEMGFVPKGSYMNSCDDIHITLMAQCKEKNGDWTWSTLDITDYTPEKGDIANIDGKLIIK